MSIPSSRLEVATRHGMRPAFRCSSISTRCSRASEPWCARDRAIASRPPRELVEPEREPLGEPPVVDEHDRRAVLRARARAAPGRSRARSSARSARSPRSSRRRPGIDRLASSRLAPSSRMSSTGMTTSRSSSLRVPASTSCDLPAVPATKRPISSSGRCVADRPMRWNGCSTTRSRRSSESARCAPRFVPATACTSSRITVSTAPQHLAALRREQQEERLRGGDQDVGRRAQHLLALALRRVAGADADRELRAACPASGPRRLRSTS